MRVILPAGLAEEGHDDHAGHVEAGDARRDDGEHTDQGALLERRVDDGVLGPVTGERRDTDDREVAGHEGHEGHDHDSAKRAVSAHVHIVVHAVHDRAGSEEQPCLEDTVGEQVEDREDVADRAEACSQHHVADLAHR